MRFLHAIRYMTTTPFSPEHFFLGVMLVMRVVHVTRVISPTHFPPVIFAITGAMHVMRVIRVISRTSLL